MHLSSWTVGISLALAGLAAAEKPTPAASNRPTASTNSMPMLEDGKPAKMTVILDDASKYCHLKLDNFYIFKLQKRKGGTMG
ncbi:hypothetical protein N7492_002162 [Penicillium capsulatum]|uniref:Uncharacterized protein n=1 Tax=Penicillium capsulatum TaxID=69766 RepID=A0A9W9IJM5_9EURO|nr:hypothetical protein N7492_002162 [Penicillium capsulatum]KAJ6123228.1 hypothetical protein N7512_005693 [Penicillium capsulatum]